jgi:hypothetical protein
MGRLGKSLAFVPKDFELGMMPLNPSHCVVGVIDRGGDDGEPAEAGSRKYEKYFYTHY